MPKHARQSFHTTGPGRPLRSPLSFLRVFIVMRMKEIQSLRVEAAYVFLKSQYSMAVNKVRGLENVAVYALYSVLCHVLKREAAENMGGRTRRCCRRSSTRDASCFPVAGCVV